MPCSRIVAVVFTLLSFATAHAQPDNEDFPRGLLATYSVAQESIERVDTVISFDWGADPPDPRLPRGDFSARWTGNVLVKVPGRHRFHVSAIGSAKIAIDGKDVLNTQASDSGQTRDQFTTGEDINLTAGDHQISIEYATPAESDKPQARLAVFWSSDKFTLEPLPADALFRDETSLAWIEAYGQKLSDAFRCAACHRSNSTLPPLKAPALDRVNGSQPTHILITRLMQPDAVVSNSHMPHFAFTKQEAESVAAFLTSVSKKPQKSDDFSFKKGDVSAGHLLLNSLGCVACHQVRSVEKLSPLSTPYDAPELVNVAQRRSANWLDRWLRDPASLNVDHQMPVFDLSKDERRQLVAALTDPTSKIKSETADASAVSSDAQIVAAGRELVKTANCAGCHSIPGMKSSEAPQLTDRSFQQTGKDCLLGDNKPLLREGRRLPKYVTLLGSKADAIMDAVSTRRQDSPLNAADRGLVFLNRKGCTACHDRNLSRGLSSVANLLQKTHEDLNGQSQGMIPPPLTAVGDRLHDDFLAKAIAGDQKERRLPWLLVRMPRFQHTEIEKASILHHLITTDRIPDAADAARQDVLSHLELKQTATTSDLLLGNQLTGAGGFNCVACHRAGPFEPRNVALGTRGSDIMTMGDRIRPRFFQRWMQNPIRIVAGVEMPAIKKAMPGILNDSLPAQIGMIWKALSDKRFTPPTVTSRFEQVVNVEEGSPPRVIRDVFTIGTGAKREAVARAMAIGFGNGHNILVDLDRMQVRLWTMGEFARQRTEGKSWYWDMPGVVVRGDTQRTPFALEQTSGAISVALSDEGRFAELLSYRQLPNGVEVVCGWRFVDGSWIDRDASTQPHFAPTRWQRVKNADYVVTRHRFEAVVDSPDPPGDGFRHSVTLVDAPEGSKLTGWLAVTRDMPSQYPSPIVATIGAGRWSRIPLNETKSVVLKTDRSIQALPVPAKRIVKTRAESVTTTPGFAGSRLPIDTSVMPTSIAWLPDGRMVFTSLKGHVWIIHEDENNSLSLELFEEGLAAPFGILTDKDSVIVAHKPEILRLRDTDGDGKADTREVVAAGWGFNDNYHDWTSGLIRDPQGNLYVGLGSDYSQKDRPKDQDRWRGGVIKIAPSGRVTPIAMSMRYPMSLAFDGKGRLFATDNQGVQNTFNEINHILPNRHYGVPSIHQPTEGLKHETPAVMVPHPWTRSVNSILFLPDDFPIPKLRGHGIGCEYDSRFLMRFTVQDVDGTLQGASYRFSLPDQEAGGSNFIGPICSAVSPKGDIVIGSIWDSGWQGGRNTGGITRLVPDADALPNGIRAVRAMRTGFEVEFFEAIDKTLAANPDNWSLQAYTRKWGGNYATPDSGRHSPEISDIEVDRDNRRVWLIVKDLRPGFMYDITVKGPLKASQKLWPSEAHYSMKVVPK